MPIMVQTPRHRRVIIILRTPPTQRSAIAQSLVNNQQLLLPLPLLQSIPKSVRLIQIFQKGIFFSYVGSFIHFIYTNYTNHYINTAFPFHILFKNFHFPFITQFTSYKHEHNDTKTILTAKSLSREGRF